MRVMFNVMINHTNNYLITFEALAQPILTQFLQALSTRN